MNFDKIVQKVKIKLAKDKMNFIDLKSYYDKNKEKKEWLSILSKFPEMLQKEIIDERGSGNKEDLEEIKNWKLLSKNPVKVSILKLLANKENLHIISTTPSEVVDSINKKWNINVKPSKVYDQNPKRYFEYAKKPRATAKPSVLKNGEVYWGVGRFIAALLRGDNNLLVWNIQD